MDKQFETAVALLRNAKHAVAFTGAGLSVERGIPPFRGDDGIWSKYDPAILELSTYLSTPEKVWPVIRKLFFNYFADAKPNAAHLALAKLESAGMLKGVITQNIDNLHQEAGSKNVIEYHGNSKTFICTKNNQHVSHANEVDFQQPYPKCPVCDSLCKPSFIFFGEAIPVNAIEQSEWHAANCDVMLIVGSTGQVVPAANIPFVASRNGCKIIEINPEPSAFTYEISNFVLKGTATKVLSELITKLNF
jgi:NAD-dependent deacetylase